MVSWIDAQTGVLGSVLIEPGLAPRLLAETSASDYSGQHLAVYQAVAALIAEGSPVDVVTIGAKLGPAYKPTLVALMELTPTAANFDSYVEIVKEQSRLTALHDLAVELTGAVTLEDARGILSKAQDVATDASSKRIFTMMQMLQDFFAEHQRQIASTSVGALAHWTTRCTPTGAMWS